MTSPQGFFKFGMDKEEFTSGNPFEKFEECGKEVSTPYDVVLDSVNVASSIFYLHTLILPFALVLSNLLLASRKGFVQVGSEPTSSV